MKVKAHTLKAVKNIKHIWRQCMPIC
ncbi:uncharacterized protein METZ01_LOCUS515067, partial [marine metagenome]